MSLHVKIDDIAHSDRETYGYFFFIGHTLVDCLDVVVCFIEDFYWLLV